MRIIAKSTLREFWKAHPDAEVPLKTWHKIVEKADWKNPHDVKSIFTDASIVGNNRVVFNIKGNKYRLVVYIIFQLRKVFIRFIGPHNAYDKIDAKRV
jgi:mRNA interferase HigB